MNYTCPVCFYPWLPYPPREYHICPCCSTEFGNDDAIHSREQLREMWIAGGANWFFGGPPQGWNPWLQLLRAGLGSLIPHFAFSSRLEAGEGTVQNIDSDETRGRPDVRAEAVCVSA